MNVTTTMACESECGTISHAGWRDKDTFSDRATSYYDHLMTLFRLIDKGDTSIGLPPYNGGLFASETATLLEEVRLPDATIANIIYDLSHIKGTQEDRRFVNYRDYVGAATWLDL